MQVGLPGSLEVRNFMIGGQCEAALQLRAVRQMVAIYATRFKISRPDQQDEQQSDAPGRRLAQGDSTPPDC
eukprot:1123418-Pelagomonas_calceolata.AAC.1